ncbi:restriction endonuclease [candidate division WWE3 bacterium CG_4_9_14_3_um_filter_34_6]|uniref:Restriction endonuclease n=1 Tax=candidate division WWE3 bacterium CG_4_9_14_3_um_filter_34_6 TaxID=1975079 RepID=A0A2M7X4X9_UNCKA|nr:MAG: restriction endonuclease [candidate division WWE3 bacterium CG_4_9_14_3_um_filter_34_6]
MKISGLYSFAGGLDFIAENYPNALDEIEEAIAEINAEECKTKTSKEKTMMGRLLYSPVELNKKFVEVLEPRGWTHGIKEYCDYPKAFYVKGYVPSFDTVRPFRDMDFIKNKLGCEVQFGKYSFMVYNVCAKMTIFRNLGHIIAGIEIVPVKELATQMSTGVSYFEQFVWDLEKRGESNIDVPVLIIGINT